MFDALLLERTDTGAACRLATLDDDRLPPDAPGEVLVAPAWSTINFKDALALTHRGPVVRLWPMVPGIDAAGTVLASSDPRWQPGDLVVHNGWGVGETRWGCLSQRVRLKADWLVRLPTGLSARQAMALGTAGYTAMLCVMALERHGLRPGDGEVLVTGATGGVGSVAIALLARAGHRVAAVTGKADKAGYLQRLGAASVIDRAELAAAGKPLQKERWAGVVDTLGSHALANALAQTRYGGVVAACGLAQGGDLPTSVMPFILRNVTLAGVDSVMAPLATRQAAWQRLATDIDLPTLESMVQEVALADAPAAAQALMDGRQTGRIVVRIPAV